MRKVLIISLLLMAVAGIAYGIFAEADYGIELLVYDTNHWTETADPQLLAEYIDANRISLADIGNRPRKGDIIEVADWPHYTRFDPNNWGGHAFRVVVIKGVRIEDARHYMLKTTGGSRRFRTLTGRGDKVFVATRAEDAVVEEKDR